MGMIKFLIHAARYFISSTLFRSVQILSGDKGTQGGTKSAEPVPQFDPDNETPSQPRDQHPDTSRQQLDGPLLVCDVVLQA